MKAAVLHEYGTVPRYEDFPDPAAAVVISSAYAQIVQWTRDGKLAVGTDRTPLSDIETAWQRTDLRGRRLIITP